MENWVSLGRKYFLFILYKYNIMSHVSSNRIFNTNNLWMNLKAVNRLVKESKLHMEVIVNNKVCSVDQFPKLPFNTRDLINSKLNV